MDPSLTAPDVSSAEGIALRSSPWRLWRQVPLDSVPAAKEEVSGMDASREAHVMTLRQHIEHSGYRVDPQAVACAIVERLLASCPLPSSGPTSPVGRSGEVLEAG